MTSRHTDLREIDERERERENPRYPAARKCMCAFVHTGVKSTILLGTVRDAKRFEVSMLHGHTAVCSDFLFLPNRFS